MYRSVFGVGVRVLQVAARQHGLLSVVKSDGSEFFPVADDRLLNYDFVEGEFPLK
jgi:hypothetical protein